MRYIILLLILVGLLVGGCASIVPTKQAEFEGAPLFYDEEGRAVVEKVGPDGKEREPVMVYDVEKSVGIAHDAVGKLAQVTPAPFAEILLTLSTFGLAGLGYLLRRANKKKLEALLDAEQAEAVAQELILSIESDSRVLSAVKKHLADKHSPELKEVVEKFTG